MSRAGTPFSDAGGDAFLPSIEHEDGLYGGYTHLFEDGAHSAAVNFEGSTATTPLDGVYDSSGVASPEIDLGVYDFEATYPRPDELPSASPYPLHPHLQHQHHGKRPPPHRSTTAAPSPLHVFTHTHHRRSWSQNDADRFFPGVPGPQYYPHPQPLPNPTFFRLSETRRPRASSRSRKSRTSTPMGGSSVQLTGSAGGAAVKMVHMSHKQQRGCSLRVIEVGAMAVINAKGVRGREGEEMIDPVLRGGAVGEKITVSSEDKGPGAEGGEDARVGAAFEGAESPLSEGGEEIIRMLAGESASP